MIKIIFSLIILSVSINALGVDKVDKGVVHLSGNRLLVYESQSFNSKKMKLKKSIPTFLFLPGIYRGQRPEDAFVKALNDKKIDYVIFDFAEHPASVVETDPSKAPDFSRITPVELAEEVDALVEHLQLLNVVPVTLSFSSTVTNYLNPDKYPLVIEAAPIGKDTDTLPPEIVAMYEAWAKWLKLNPFGEIWLKNAKEVQLNQLWSSHVASLTSDMPKLNEPAYKDRAIKGYKALTHASEGFDLREQDFAKGPKRFFVLGENEEKVRAEIQIEAILNYQKQTGHKDNVYVIPGAGHIVTADKPELLIEILKLITSGK